MTFGELRRAIEAISHHKGYCDRSDALTALATLERQHAERERRLREDVLQWLDNGFSYADTFPESETIRVYDDQDVNFAHRKLAEILGHPRISLAKEA